MKVYSDDIEDVLGPAPGVSPTAGGAYEASSRYSRELASYVPALQSADGDMLWGKETADARVRDMRRNDAYVHHGGQLRVDGVVGSHYRLNAKPDRRHLARQDSAFDETWEKEHQEEVESLWYSSVETNACFLDASRQMPFTEMIRLVISMCFYGGESLATLEWERDAGRPFSTCFNFVECDRLETPPWMMNRLDVTAGIRHSRFGAPKTYYIRKAHPAEIRDPKHFEFHEVPAYKPWGRPQVLHIKRNERPEQTRAISDVTCALAETRIGKRFRQVLLQNAVTNASFAASIESELPTELIASQLGAQEGRGGVGAAAGAYAKQFMSYLSQYARGSEHMHIDGAKIPHFFPGTKLNMTPMGTPGGVGTDFESSLIRYLSAGVGVSYEELSNDLSKTNYAGLKAALGKTARFNAGEKRLLADRAANTMYQCFYEEMLNKNMFTTLPRSASETANFYDGLNRYAYTRADWIGAGVYPIDELKETQAAVLRIKNGLSTYEKELSRRGEDWREVFEQTAREYDAMPEHIQTAFATEDNMMNAASGDERETSATDGNDAGSGGDSQETA